MLIGVTNPNLGRLKIDCNSNQCFAVNTTSNVTIQNLEFRNAAGINGGVGVIYNGFLIVYKCLFADSRVI